MFSRQYSIGRENDVVSLQLVGTASSLSTPMNQDFSSASRLRLNLGLPSGEISGAHRKRAERTAPVEPEVLQRAWS